MQVKATAVGYFETVRREGDIFEIEDETQLGSWMVVIEERTKPKKAPAKKKTSTKKKA